MDLAERWIKSSVMYYIFCVVYFHYSYLFFLQNLYFCCMSITIIVIFFFGYFRFRHFIFFASCILYTDIIHFLAVRFIWLSSALQVKLLIHCSLTFCYTSSFMNINIIWDFSWLRRKSGLPDMKKLGCDCQKQRRY